MTSRLRLSLNSKTTPMVKERLDGRASTYPLFANSFGLPAGESCPGKTAFCNDCYAVETEGRPNVYKNVSRNLNILRDLDEDAIYELLSEMMADYRLEISKKNIPPELDIFRIHWDGDFFNLEYARAWKTVIEENPNTQFWTYTRSFRHPVNVVPELYGIDNLAFYLSVDEGNLEDARVVLEEYPKMLIAFCAEDIPRAELLAAKLGKKYTTVCPENSGEIPLMSNGKGACANCLLCPKSRPNILFIVDKSDPMQLGFVLDVPTETSVRISTRKPANFDLSLLNGSFTEPKGVISA